MKIAIGPVFSEYGGVSQHIFGIKKYSSHKVIEIPRRFIRTALVLDKSRYGTALYRKIMNAVNLNRYDVVHSHVDPWYTNLCLSSRTLTCKWIHTYHTLYFEEDYPNGLQIWQKVINRVLIEVASKADVKISISKWLHDYLYENFSIQTQIIHNGVDLEACDKANPDRFRAKYKLYDDFALFVGNMQPIKNPGLFIDLAKQIPDLKFVMIGKGLNATWLAKEYNVPFPKNLVLLGKVNHCDALNATAACRILVMTSRREGIPTVLLEAMAMRKPVVVPDHSGCKEIVVSEECGLLYKPNSLDDLVEQTWKALASTNIGERARKRVAQQYSWKILAKSIDLAYERKIAA